MDKAITTALLIVISMIMAVSLFNVAYPAIVEGGDAIASMADRAGERIRSQIAIVHAAAEWQNGAPVDMNSSGDLEAYIWVKNIGDARIAAVERVDVFFGQEGNFARIPHASESTSGTYWQASIDNAAEWTPTATLRITIRNAPLQAGRQFVKVVAPNGVWDEYFWSL
ncbi:MAG: hypothetical protein GX573_26460 [Chloroflexi bacterium]|nr:hypothetical protein [Chloroflexota bacterium]